MATIYKFDAAGGFVVGDTATRHTSYALPSSPYARDARRAAETIAQVMVVGANAFAAVLPAWIVAERNALNWARFREPQTNLVYVAHAS